MSSPSASQTPIAPFLQTTRKFPLDADGIQRELTKWAVDVANTVNVREIGFYDLSPTLTGQKWYSVQPTNSPQNPATKRQTFRKVFPFSDASLTINHGITGAVFFTSIYGSATNGTLFFPIPYVSATAADQIGITVSSTQILVAKGGGAPPVITTGVIVLEWLIQ